MISIDRIKRLLKKGEGLHTEYKEARNRLPANTFDTICAFLNRDGGDLLLGVDDSGNVLGVDKDIIDKLKRDLVSQSNNPDKLNPPFILFPKIVELKGKTIIHVQVPQSSQVHKTRGIVFDRSEDGDYRVTDPDQIALMVNRKRTHYTEGMIYPAVRFDDFNKELFHTAKNLIRSNQPNHPWLALDDGQMLVKAGLKKRDFKTGEEGYTLSAVLLFGKDEVIQQILPHYKIDALVRIENIDRYDDRLIIRTNLIDAYDQLMGFVGKHLPDKFFMEGGRRLSLRDNLFREVIANLLIHREYTNALPATFTVFNDRVEIENANNPHGRGPISVNDFTPFPKNPSISKFYMQLGRVEELGSGIINVNRLIKNYTPGKRPSFIEGDVFKTVVPIEEQKAKRKKEDTGIYKIIHDTVSDTFLDTVNENVRQRLAHILMLLYQRDSLKVKDFVEEVGKSERTVKGDLKLLMEKELVRYEGSPKTGHYRIAGILKDRLYPQNIAR